MPLRNAIPIKDTELWPIKIELPQEINSVLEQYLSFYQPWVLDSNNEITGLENFQSAKFCHGTVQAFDHFYIKHCQRRMRFLPGEFMYHRACIKHSLRWEYINHDDLRENDALIISVPFSDLGQVHPDTEALLNECDRLGIPVLIDMAYICISRNVKINLNHDCVETVTTSLSKAFYGAQYLRAGIRWEKINRDDGIDVFNSVEMAALPSIAIGLDFMFNHKLDWAWKKYGTAYDAVIKQLNLQPTNCILFGLGDQSYQEYNRGNTLNRVCISPEIGEHYVRMQSQ
jgi:hypothetical protein